MSGEFLWNMSLVHSKLRNARLIKAKQCSFVCTMSSNKILKMPIWSSKKLDAPWQEFHLQVNPCILHDLFIHHLNLSIILQLLPHGNVIEWLAPNFWRCIRIQQFRVHRLKRGYLKRNIHTYIHTYIYMYVCMYVHTNIDTYISININDNARKTHDRKVS